jgi:putative thioredoxin
MAKLLTQDGRHADAFAILDALPVGLRGQPQVRRLHTHLGFLVEAGQAPPESELESDLARDAERLDLRLALGARRLLADDYDSALRQLAEIHRRDPGFRGEVGRRGLLAIIEQLGPDDPRVGSYRRLRFQH